MQFLRRMPGRPISITAVAMPRPFQFGWLTAVGFVGVCVGGATAVSISDQPPSPYTRVASSYLHENAISSDGARTSGLPTSSVIFRGLDPWLGGASKHALKSRNSAANDPHQVTSDSVETIDRSSSASSSANDARTHLANCDGVVLSVSSSVQGQRRSMEDDFDLAARGHFAAVFDGHGGREVARYAKLALYDQVCAHLELPGLGDEEGNRTEGEHPVETALRRSIAKLEKDVNGLWRWRGVGSTLCAVCVVDAGHSHVDDGNGGVDTATAAGGQSSVARMRRHHSGGGDGEFALGIGGRSTFGDDAAEAPLRYAITANLGDSRAVLCRAGKAMDLTQDHKPDLPAEKQRVEALGGRVAWHGLWTESFSRDDDSASLAADMLPTATSSISHSTSSRSTSSTSRGAPEEQLPQQRVPLPGTGVWRVNGNLAVSRALGDAGAKPWVSGAPELRKIALDEAQDEFILVASDGLWDVMSSDEAVAFVRGALGNHLATSSSSTSSAAAAAAAARTPGTVADNYSDHAALLASSPTETAASSRLHGKSPLESPLSAAEVQQRKRQMARCLTEEAERLGTTDNVTVLVLWLK